MTMHKQHPQRCLHSHICKFNRDNYEDCIDTDCTHHRYTYNSQIEREKVLDEYNKNPDAFEIHYIAHPQSFVIRKKEELRSSKVEQP